jgi:hypothetical protein
MDPVLKAARRKRFEMLRTLSKRLKPKVAINKQDADWDRILRVKNLHLLVFSMIGLAASIGLSYFKWAFRCVVVEGNCVDNAQGIEVTATSQNTYNTRPAVWASMLTGQFILSSSTFVCVFLIIQLYKLRLVERRREWSGLEELDLIEDASDGAYSNRQLFRMSYDFWKSDLRYQCFIELIVHILHPVVYIETLDDDNSVTKPYQTVYEVLECFVFIRVYLILRVLYIHSPTYISRFEIIKSNPELQRADYRINMISTAKKNDGLWSRRVHHSSVRLLDFCC